MQGVNLQIVDSLCLILVSENGPIGANIGFMCLLFFQLLLLRLSKRSLRYVDCQMVRYESTATVTVCELDLTCMSRICS